jgi:D-alanyl-D-alanine carboxypeptidase
MNHRFSPVRLARSSNFSRASHPTVRTPLVARAVSVLVLGGLLAACAGVAPSHTASSPSQTRAPQGNHAGISAVVDRAAADGFRGIVLVARGSVVLHASRHGPLHADNPAGPALTLQSPVRLASLTKQMVSTLVMQDVERGRLKLDDTLGSHWPDFPMPAARAVTLRQLLMHQSGLPKPNPKSYGLAAHANVERLHHDAATGMCAGRGRGEPVTTLAFPPGQGFAYNNCDYLVIGALLERLHGRSVAALLDERIFKPAAMATATLCVPSSDITGHARGTEKVDGKLLIDSPFNPAGYGAAGAACGTALDVLAYNRAWAAGTLLGASARAEQTRANTWGAALGIWSFTLSEGTQRSVWVERQGWINGIRWLNLLAPSDEISVIVMSTQTEWDLSSTNQGKGLGADLIAALR